MANPQSFAEVYPNLSLVDFDDIDYVIHEAMLKRAGIVVPEHASAWSYDLPQDHALRQAYPVINKALDAVIGLHLQPTFPGNDEPQKVSDRGVEVAMTVGVAIAESFPS
jgi:hypothetical protein